MLQHFDCPYSRLCQGSRDLEELGQGQNDIPLWVEMLLAFRCVGEDVYGEFFTTRIQVNW